MALWKHQQDYVDLAFSTERGYSLWNSEAGTGKTLTALTVLSKLDGKRLVICPKPAIGVWQADVDQFMPNANFEIVSYSTGTIKDKYHAMKTDKRKDVVYVLNYEIAGKIPLQEFGFSGVVCDESHRLGQHNGIQSMAIAKSTINIPLKVSMTGTPYTEGLDRVYGITRQLDCYIPLSRKAHPQARLFGHWNDFLDNFCVTYLIGYTRIISEYKNQKRLADIMRPFTKIVYAKDVIDMPELVTRKYEYAPSKKLLEYHKSIEDEGAVILSEDETLLVPHILTRVIRMQQLASSGELIETGIKKAEVDITGRVDIFGNIIEELGDQPVVVFTKYVREVELLTERLTRMGISYRLLTGYEDTHEEWKRGDAQILIANLSAGSEGVRLERSAHIIFWSVGFSLKDFVQAHARVRRAGQKAKTVFAHYIVTKDTIDEGLYHMLSDKSRDVSVMDKLLQTDS